MKKIFFYIILSAVAVLSACKKHDYAEGTLSPISALEEVRNLYKGTDVTLNPENLKGAYQIVGVVISDFSGGNNPEGLMVIQSNRNKRIRGISIPMGASASTYLPGDSLKINVEGSVLRKVNGSLQLTGITDASIEKISSNNAVAIQSVTTLELNSKPNLYESTLVSVNAASFSPVGSIGETYAGDKNLLSGTNSVTLHTEVNAAYANELLPLTINAKGIVYLSQPDAEPGKVQLWPRALTDIVDVSDPVIDPVASKYKIIITGFANDVKGSDGNYEYVQMIATTDIDFSKTPFSVITCTNAGAAAPNAGAAPGAGWATGGGRTYKFNLKSGIVRKGEFFYVGGSNKKINGPNSTDISGAKWIRTIAYVTNAGDGLGDKSGGLLPNSGNAGGIALFAGTNIKEETVPMDVVFFGGTGKTTIVDIVNGKGYRVAENDRYSATDASGNAQPFFYQGTNTYVITYLDPSDQGDFVKLGGNFDVATKQWITPRAFNHFIMTPTTNLTEIETGSDVIVLSN